MFFTGIILPYNQPSPSLPIQLSKDDLKEKHFGKNTSKLHEFSQGLKVFS